MRCVLYNNKLYVESDELYHYGIKGMRWGVRRYQKKDGTLTIAGKNRKTQQTITKKSGDRDHSQSDKSEILDALYTLALSVYNPIALVSSVDRLGKAGYAAAKTSIYNKDREGCKTDKKTGLLLKKKTMSSEEDRARVNPSFYNFDANTKNNCMLCTCAYDLRRRGYEVRAKKASYGYHQKEINAWYPKAKLKTINDVPDGKNIIFETTKKETITKVKNELIKQGNGARGNMMIVWKHTTAAHSVAYEVSNNNVTFIDAQCNKTYKDPDSFLKKCAPTFTYARLDNVDFNTKNIKEVGE
jgi:hypothetical protein